MMGPMDTKNFRFFLYRLFLHNSIAILPNFLLDNLFFLGYQLPLELSLHLSIHQEDDPCTCMYDDVFAIFLYFSFYSKGIFEIYHSLAYSVKQTFEHLPHSSHCPQWVVWHSKLWHSRVSVSASLVWYFGSWRPFELNFWTIGTRVRVWTPPLYVPSSWRTPHDTEHPDHADQWVNAGRSEMV